MLFWGTHSTGKFDEKTIGYALDYDIESVRKELQSLINAGVVEKEGANGSALYFLTSNEAKRGCIIEATRPGHSSSC
jgi:hypothetical protein